MRPSRLDGLLVFLAGFGVMALELLASRWMAPVFGFTLTTWAWLIAVTLFGGGVGAGLAAAWSRRASRRTVGFALLGAGAWAAADAWFGPRLLEAFLPLPIATGTALGAAALLLVPVTLLAMVLPWLIGRVRTADPGRRAGLLIAASALGSLGGTLGLALGLAPGLGLGRAGLVVAAALGAGGLLALLHGPSRALALPLLVLPFLVPTPGASAVEGVVRDSPYGRITLRRGKAGLTLAVDGIAQTTLAPGPVAPGTLLRHGQLVELLVVLRPEAERALQIGLGGGLVARMFEAHDVACETYEIDPDLVAIVEAHLGPAGTVHVGDGRALLRRSART